MNNPIAAYTHWLHTRWPAGTVEKLPVTGENGITDLPGVRIAGDLSGIPLLKFSSLTATMAVRAILKEPEFQKRDTSQADVLDLAIIGAGLLIFTLSMDEIAVSFFLIGRDNTLPLEIWSMTLNVTSPSLYALGTVTTIVSFVIIAICLGAIASIQKRRAVRVPAT